MPEVFVGTSGWTYDWNLGRSLSWYARYSGLNAVELNASFHRTPLRDQVASWSKKGRSLRWAVKVHRYITHTLRLSDRAIEAWKVFADVFRPMEDLIDFYLVQLPPTYTFSRERLDRVRAFAARTRMDNRIAVEFRHSSWFTLGDRLCHELEGILPVSVDSPQATWLVGCSGLVYLRLHGRSRWRSHNYSDSELAELIVQVRRLNPKRVYIFFNNEHWTLENARRLLRLLAI